MQFNLQDLMNLFHSWHAGGVLGILIICSLVSIAVVVERYFFFKKNNINTPELLTRVRKGLETNKEELLRGRRKEDSCVATVVNMGLMNRHMPLKELEEILNVTQIKQKFRLERNLGVLGTLGPTAPFIGLLGTVFGIIEAFKGLAGSGANAANNVAVGISEALVATAAGLAVAIPAVIFYNMFSKKSKKILADMDAASRELLLLINLHNQGKLSSFVVDVEAPRATGTK